MRKQLVKTIALFLVPMLMALLVHAQQVTPATALQSYLKNGDKTFKWEVKDSFMVKDVRGYNLLLTSQQWREFTWKHQLTVFIPAEVQYSGALLFITGGSLKEGEPKWNNGKDGLSQGVGKMAADRKAVTAVLRQTPNQPLFDNLTEDALISFTLHNFKKDNDYTWPLLFPMVKSAVRAMDAVQEFTAQQATPKVEKFVVAGASKRGWTTWLTGANDNRVAGIAPMVIDILNMPVSLDYQIKSWNEYSIQIEDYVKLGIPQTAHTPGGEAINTMVDPYSYRANLTMPKMLFMGTNDEYWVVDNVKNYINDIPGKYFINYVPNEGHSMGDGQQVFNGLSSFFGMTISGGKYPQLSYSTSTGKTGVNLTATASADLLEDVILWTASSSDLDFRNDKWSSKSLGIARKSKVKVQQPFPASGYGAFYVDFKYRDANGGSYLVSTRVYLTDTKKVL
jgi:PhoPQ-activated pathogenicity-related protein